MSVLQALMSAVVMASVAYVWALTAFPGETREAASPPIVVSGVHYVLDEAHPPLLRAVQLTLASPLSGDARVKVRFGNGRWYACRLTGARAECSIAPPLPLTEVERLEVEVVPP